jgi:hypothetical protein
VSRTLTVLDRVLVLILALALIALGVSAVVWQSGRLSLLRGTLRAPWLATATTTPWWPWATGATGVILVILALRWIAAHITSSKVADVRMAGSTPAGRLTIDLGALATAAAASVQDTPGVRTTTGRALNDRGRRTITLTITLDPHADLTTVTTATDQACTNITTALGDRATALRVHLRTARTTQTNPRVT